MNSDESITEKTILTEAMEKRQLAEGNLQEQNTRRMQRRESVQSALKRIRDAAIKDKKQKFTTLMHHIYSIDVLFEAYFSLERNASAGIDGVTWKYYGENLEDNIRDLSHRLERGAYRAKPVKRTYIPKADGKQRPLGVPVLETKLFKVQQPLYWVRSMKLNFSGSRTGID